MENENAPQLIQALQLIIEPLYSLGARKLFDLLPLVNILRIFFFPNILSLNHQIQSTYNLATNFIVKIGYSINIEAKITSTIFH